jgi:hypothetical protein
MEDQPPLSRFYQSVTVLYCSYSFSENFAFASGRCQLYWWNNFNQLLEILLGRYGAVTAERDDRGVCGVFGIGLDTHEQDQWQALKAVQCTLDILDAVQDVSALQAQSLHFLIAHGQIQ